MAIIFDPGMFVAARVPGGVGPLHRATRLCRVVDMREGSCETCERKGLRDEVGGEKLLESHP
jgi:hypothetical protein